MQKSEKAFIGFGYKSLEILYARTAYFFNMYPNIILPLISCGIVCIGD
jgi:hypothetical protein